LFCSKTLGYTLTVPGRGYRFVAKTVREAAVCEAVVGNFTLLRVQAQSAK